MAATRAEVGEWAMKGKSMGATHLISVCDTFGYDDYPVYVMPGESVEDKRRYYGTNMQMVNEVIDLRGEQ